MLGISFGEHTTNEYVCQQVSILAGPQELPFMFTIKLSFFFLLSAVNRQTSHVIMVRPRLSP